MGALGEVESIYWEERWLELVAAGSVELPAYTGSTLRGALGAVMRPSFCSTKGSCLNVCMAPESCWFYSLFEQSRAERGAGPNIPKPLILESPVTEPLREIAAGGLVEAPYRLTDETPLPGLSNNARISVRNGEVVILGLRALGAAGSALDRIVEGVAQKGLAVSGGKLRLRDAKASHSSIGEMLGTLEVAGGRRLRLALVTPTMIKAGKGVCLDPHELGKLVLHHAVVRAVTIYNAFFAQRENRLPFVSTAWPDVLLTAHRLFHYHFPRQSYRQGRWMEFEGVVGWMEWEGDVSSIFPWLKAAEALHIGQKATFGMGRVEILEVSG